MTKRILLCNETSYLNSGFGRYGLEVQKRLFQTGKYDIAELGCAADVNDPRSNYLPWKYYNNSPTDNEKPTFGTKRSHKFGEWRFEQVALHFKPHIVWDIRDWWMMEFEERSPARPYFHWVVMPTVDSEPQHEPWLATFLNADGVLAYTNWAANLLKQQTNNKIKFFKVAPPAADYEVFKPIENKSFFKQRMGLPNDSLFIGTVMRNQQRKLYPDLIETFGSLLREGPKEIADKLYLYLHVTWPDKRGWDIPRLLKDNGVAHRTYFSYICRKCKSIFPSLFRDGKTFCKVCGEHEAMLPNVYLSADNETLAKIYNCLDVYVQYSSCEGFGIPQVEAAACGVHVMAVDYSAMSEVVRAIKGTPIKVQRMTREQQTHTLKALPCNETLKSELINYLKQSEHVKRRKGFETRKAAQSQYTWDKAAKVWGDYFDSVETIDKWNLPAKIHKPNLNVPSGLSNDEFVRWCMSNIAGRPDLEYSFVSSALTQNLNFGYVVNPIDGDTEGEFKNEVYTRESLVKHFLKACEYSNIFERTRNVPK